VSPSTLLGGKVRGRHDGIDVRQGVSGAPLRPRRGPRWLAGCSEEVDRPWAKGRRECGFAVCGQGRVAPARARCRTPAGRNDRAPARLDPRARIPTRAGAPPARLGKGHTVRSAGLDGPPSGFAAPHAPIDCLGAPRSRREEQGELDWRTPRMHRSRGFRRTHPGGHENLDPSQIPPVVVIARQPQCAGWRHAQPTGGSSACQCKRQRRRVRTTRKWW